MKIMTLHALISPTSAAGHVVLKLILTAWDVRGTQRGRRSSPRATPQVTSKAMAVCNTAPSGGHSGFGMIANAPFHRVLPAAYELSGAGSTIITSGQGVHHTRRPT